MARERWKDIQFNIPSILPLQPPPQTQEQVIPYIQALHNYLADDRLKVARAINLSNYFRMISYDDPADGDEFIANDTKTQLTDENTMLMRLDTKAYSGTPNWEYYHTLATHVDVEQSDATYNSLQDLINQMFSSGVISGFELTDAGSYQVAIAAGTCLLADSDDPNDRVIRFVDYAGETTAAIADGETKHILIEWNGGSPAYAFHASADLDQKDAFTLGWVTREGTTLHITNAPVRVNELPHNVAHYLREVLGFTRANALGGLILGNTGTRNPTLSAGEIYFGLNEFDISAVDCSGADTFTRYYPVAGTWTKETGLTQWPNAQYSDGTNLQAMTVNRYGCLWFYVDLEDGELIMLYGTSNAATQTTAESEAPPATVPERVAEGSVLVGRYVFQNGGSAPLEVQSAFNAAFNPSGTTDHTQLSNIGTNTHAQIDTHIADTSNPHSVTLAQVGGAAASHTHTESDITDLDHTDANAIHDNVAGEIDALANVDPSWGDLLLIEDSSDSYNKKEIFTQRLFRFDTVDRGIYLYVNNNSGGTLSKGDIVYVNGDSSGTPTVASADADAASTGTGMLLMMYSGATNGNSSWALALGVINGFTGLTAGAVQYLSTTAKGRTETAPSGSSDIVRVIGHAISATEIYFNPSNSWVEIA